MKSSLPIGVQFKSDSHRMKHRARCSYCQKKTPRKMPESLLIWTPIGTEKYNILYQKNMIFNTVRNMKLFLPIGVQFKSDSHKMKHRAKCPYCQNKTPRKMPESLLIWTPIETEKYLTFISKKYAFKN